MATESTEEHGNIKSFKIPDCALPDLHCREGVYFLHQVSPDEFSPLINPVMMNRRQEKTGNSFGVIPWIPWPSMTPCDDLAGT